MFDVKFLFIKQSKYPEITDEILAQLLEKIHNIKNETDL